jgi:hypothetical protein
MKKQSKIIVAGLLLLMSFQITMTAYAQPDMSSAQVAVADEKPFSIHFEYAGMADEQPLFRMQFDNRLLKNALMTITVKDGKYQERVYSETLKDAGARKIYKLDAPGENGVIVFDLYEAGKKVYSQSFHIDYTTETKTTVSETEQ